MISLRYLINIDCKLQVSANNFIYCTFEILPMMPLFGSEIPITTEPLELFIGCRFDT
ncbi:hypothetical protein RhiirA4_489021 [Rhizophagus irregularis]|uniref:Uncharacterized protein n=1 Tax=Rhizophagus irregularis TaxID=588596 RepID=A0A2I1HUF7_9GLOM|nr:hypothetical protein RhiirA4_489021 [Rhizophagus irregularis]